MLIPLALAGSPPLGDCPAWALLLGAALPWAWHQALQLPLWLIQASHLLCWHAGWQGWVSAGASQGAGLAPVLLPEAPCRHASTKR